MHGIAGDRADSLLKHIYPHVETSRRSGGVGGGIHHVGYYITRDRADNRRCVLTNPDAKYKLAC